ncbi:MAG: 4'-phosphopantetheinyl transferase superfamily protein [Burkholderiaceae bacterium]|nr:4'-phosphopantetheinyl transferase superfamily protein [Burkholderiaceae bacterium]
MFIRKAEILSIPAMPVVTMIRNYYNKDWFYDSLFDIYGISMPVRIKQAVAKRKSEYLAARIASRDLMRLFGIDDAQITLKENRAPLWPSGIVGSITHTDNVTVIAAGRERDINGVGIDCEKIVEHEIVDKLSEHVLTENEIVLMRRMGICPRDFFTLAFSAKESLYKAVNGYYGISPEFKDAQLERLDIASGQFVVKLEVARHNGRGIYKQFNGQALFFDKYVMTLICH